MAKWVLRTNMNLSAEQVALKYKELWQVEQVFRDMKSVLDTRPIYHKRDETIRGHVFCSFLALVLRKELDRRVELAGHEFEWETNEISRPCKRSLSRKMAGALQSGPHVPGPAARFSRQWALRSRQPYGRYDELLFFLKSVMPGSANTIFVHSIALILFNYFLQL
jgi:hypothetical protein